jgi:thiamine biosynthesis lipoprotein
MKIAAAFALALSVTGYSPVATDHAAATARSVRRTSAGHVSSSHYDGVLGTSLDLKFVAATPRAATLAERVALDEIERLRRVLSSWDNQSELSQLFARGTLEHPSAELVAVLSQYQRWSARSDRAYSARVGELSALWKAAEARGTLPDSAALAAVVREIEQPAWRFDDRTGHLIALTPHRVDLNSLGKGFIIDRALQAVRDRVPSVTGAMINIGGDVHVWGTAPRDGAWHIAVADPQHHADNAPPLARLAIHGGAVSSSGDYERGFRIGAQHYSHIIDPRTGRPVSHVAGVTVIAADNATANALATTLSVLPVDRGLALLQSVRGAEALLVTSTGERFKSPGFAAYEEAGPRATPAADAATAAPAFTAKLAIDVTPTVANRHQPFVAVWITDTTGKHVRTLAFWGDKPKYQREMTKWWGLNHTDTQLIDAITRATRAVGKYSLDWDGLDQSGAAVAPGTYMFWLEVAFEDGAHSAKSATMSCGATDASATIPQAAAFTGATVSCERVKR